MEEGERNGGGRGIRKGGRRERGGREEREGRRGREEREKKKEERRETKPVDHNRCSALVHHSVPVDEYCTAFSSATACSFNSATACTFSHSPSGIRIYKCTGTKNGT